MGTEKVRAFRLNPQPDTVHEAREILTRFSWYARDFVSKGGTLYLPSNRAIDEALKLGAPFWAGKDAQLAYRNLATHFCREDGLKTKAKLIHWRGNRSSTQFTWATRNSWQLHPWADSVGDERWIDFAASCTAKRKADARGTLQARLAGKGAKVAILVGPGPSLQGFRPSDSSEIIILTLSAYLNLPPSSEIVPDIVVFADALATVGPSSIAQANRDAMITLADQGALLVTTARIARVLHSQMPSRVRSQVLGLEVSSEEWMTCSQSIIHGPLPGTNNVLTTLGLPIAASLTKTVVMVGFDGSTQPDRTFDHADQHEQLRRTSLLRAAHPNIGLKKNYYEDHRRLTALMIKRLGELNVRVSAGHEQFNASNTAAPNFSTRNRFIARSFYGLLDRFDRASPGKFATFSLVSIIICVGIMLMTQRSSLLEFALASIALSSLLVLTVAFVLRRRQNRQIEALRHDVMVSVQEMNQIVVQRIEQLENEKS